MKQLGWKPTRQALHRQLDVILTKGNRQLRETVRFVIISAYRLTLRAVKS